VQELYKEIERVAAKFRSVVDWNWSTTNGYLEGQVQHPGYQVKWDVRRSITSQTLHAIHNSLEDDRLWTRDS
jgi:hypothetical protein